MDNFISVDEAAYIAGVTEQTLRKRLKRHSFSAIVRIGRRIYLNRAEFLRSACAVAQ